MSLKILITNGIKQLKEGDTATEIKMLLIEGNGTVYDFTGKDAKFVVSNRIGKLFERPVVSSEKIGEVIFSFEEGEITGSGQIFLEIHVTQGLETKIFPSSDYLVISIDKNLNIIGQTITSYQYEQLRTDVAVDIGLDIEQLNENIDSIISDVVNGVTGELKSEIVSSAKIVWKSPVANFAALTTTYPSAVEGDTAMARDTGKVYRFDGSTWIEIQEIDPTAINEVDTRLSADVENQKKQLGDFKIVHASFFSTLQSAINYATSISGVVYVNNITETAQDITVTCPIIGVKNKSTISVRSMTIPNTTSNVTLRDFKLITNYAISLSIGRGAENITIEGLDIQPGTNFGSLSPQKRLSIIASGIDSTTPIKNLRITGNKMFIGGIQVAICDYLATNNLIDGNWENLDELIHVSYKSRGIIEGNTLINSLQDAIDIFSSGDRNIITGNRIVGVTLQGIEAKVSLTDDAGNTSSDTLGYVESTIISNNIIRDIRGTLNTSGTYLGINVAYYDNRAVKSFDPVKFPNNIIIEGNLIENFYTVPFTSGTPIFQGILFNGSNGVIKGNIIRDLKTRATGATEWKNAGIILPIDNGSVNNNIIIEGNIINTGNTCIYVNSLKDSIISNNIMAKDGKTGILPRYGIIVDGTNGNMEGVTIHGNQFECKTTYVDSGGATQQITGYAIDARNSAVVKDCLISSNRTKNGSISLYTASYTTLVNNNIQPKANNVGIEMISTLYRYGNKLINNTLHSDGNNTAIIMQYQKALVCSQNTAENFNTAVHMSGYIGNAIIKDNMQLYDTGDPIFGTCVRLGVTGMDSGTIVQSDNSQVVIS